MDIILSHIDEDEARVTLRYSGERLQLNGYGSDWDARGRHTTRRRPSSPATTGSRRSSCPKLPDDTVAETRKRIEIDALEAALENVDWTIEDR